jgi:hypothetical protein
MADKKEYKLLENIRDELKENNKKEEDKAATVENGILTQKQLLAAQEELKESQKEDATKLQQLVNLAKGQKTDSGKKKMQVNIAKQQEKMDIQSESVTKQEDMMQRAADLRGVDVEVFKEMRGNLEASNDRLTEMKAQAEKDSKLGGVDFKMRKQIAQEEKRNARLAKKAEGGKLTRAKMQMKAMAKQMMTLEGIGKGIKGLAGGAAKGVGKGAAKGVKSMFGLIMKGAMLALLPAILLFFNSPLWDKTKTFLIETALPALKKLGKFLAEKFMLVFDFLKDKILPIFVNLYKFIKDEILPIFVDNIVKTWDNIKVLFTDISDAFSKIFSGDILGGLMDLICGIGSFIGKQINAIMTAIYNIIASIFGLEKTDSVFGSIKGFFNNIYTRVKTFFSDMYTGFKNFLLGPIAKFFEPLTCAIMDVWDSVKAIFSGEDIMKNLAKLAGALLDIVYAPVNLAINFIRRIFGFGGECGGDTEPFRISKFIGDILRKVIEFFRGIFDFDIKGAVKKLIPGVLFEAPVVGGLLKKVFGMGDENKEEQVELESDSVTKAKIEEQRKKGNIGDITGMVDEYGGTAGALNRRQLEKDVVAGNSGGGNIITTNQVSTTKQTYATTNVSPVTDDDRVVKALTEK